MAEENLTKDDLVLLMESYKNMITMHHTILEQSNKTIEQLADIVTKQDNISLKQRDTCQIMNGVSTKLDSCVKQLEGTNDKVDKLKDTINTHNEKSMDGHSKLANKIHLGWIGMGTIILGLIGLGVTIYGTMHMLHP